MPTHRTANRAKATAPTRRREREIAALFVSRRTIYRHLPGVDVFDRTRDAANFAGSMPVVAHPPCRHWSKLRHQAGANLPAEAILEEKALGLFAVEQVMRWGGVLEQPAGSLLWDACQLPRCGDYSDPFCFTIYVEQAWFGFPTPKATWLLVCGVPKRLVEMPSYQLRAKSLTSFNTLNSFERSRTMEPFARYLCQLARLSWWSLP